MPCSKESDRCWTGTRHCKTSCHCLRMQTGHPLPSGILFRNLPSRQTIATWFLFIHGFTWFNWFWCVTKADLHVDVIKWKHFPRYWSFVRGIHRSPVNSPHKGQWRGALMFSLIWARINGSANNGEAGDLRRRCAHHDVNVMSKRIFTSGDHEECVV